MLATESPGKSILNPLNKAYLLQSYPKVALEALALEFTEGRNILDKGIWWHQWIPESLESYKWVQKSTKF